LFGDLAEVAEEEVTQHELDAANSKTKDSVKKGMTMEEVCASVYARSVCSLAMVHQRKI